MTAISEIRETVETLGESLQTVSSIVLSDRMLLRKDLKEATLNYIYVAIVCCAVLFPAGQTESLISILCSLLSLMLGGYVKDRIQDSAKRAGDRAELLLAQRDERIAQLEAHNMALRLDNIRIQSESCE